MEEKVLESLDREVPTSQIGNLVMRELKKLDQVAYVRFASVYKSFESPEDFAEIAEQVAKSDRRKKPAASRSRKRGGRRSPGMGAGARSARRADRRTRQRPTAA